MPTPILPDLPPLAPSQKAQLIQNCNTYPNIKRMLHYLETGELKFSDMPSLNEERRAILQSMYNEWLATPEPPKPEDPAEIQMWEQISAFGQNFEQMDASLLSIVEQNLNTYVNQFSASRPGGNHVDEAKNILVKIGKLKERAVWGSVDTMEYDAIVEYLINNPKTAFFHEAEDCMWTIVSSNFNDIDLLQKYISDVDGPFKSMRNSLNESQREIINQHLQTAQSARKEYCDWQDVKDSRDIIGIHNYLQSHPDSPFKDDIRLTIRGLKSDVLEDFKSHLSDRSYLDLFYQLTSSGIIPKNEFINAGIVSEQSLAKLKDIGKFAQIDQTMSIDSCPENHTDIFMFGIPSTGKTCIIMGLLGSDYFDWNSKIYGGNYASQLKEYLDAGLTPDSTNENFVSLVEGSITDAENENISHPISLIDMAGETFADKIATNPDNKVSFEDMGIGATKLLSSSNDKVFFIIVDPTVEVVNIKRRVARTDPDGDTYYDITNVRVSQKSTLKKLVDLFTLEENKKIMERVKAIHFIVTKSDMLDDEGDRGTVAKARMKEKYVQPLNTLKKICKESKYAINVRSGYLPKLYTFSLGQFYLGGVYDYDSSDADKILNVIRNITKGQREKTFLDKLKDALNKPIF